MEPVRSFGKLLEELSELADRSARSFSSCNCGSESFREPSASGKQATHEARALTLFSLVALSAPIDEFTRRTERRASVQFALSFRRQHIVSRHCSNDDYRLELVIYSVSLPRMSSEKHVHTVDMGDGKKYGWAE